jgi:hypothetical protein
VFVVVECSSLLTLCQDCCDGKKVRVRHNKDIGRESSKSEMALYYYSVNFTLI